MKIFRIILGLSLIFTLESCAPNNQGETLPAVSRPVGKFDNHEERKAVRDSNKTLALGCFGAESTLKNKVDYSSFIIERGDNPRHYFPIKYTINRTSLNFEIDLNIAVAIMPVNTSRVRTQEYAASGLRNVER